jgi:hypothetical protein
MTPREKAIEAMQAHLYDEDHGRSAVVAIEAAGLLIVGRCADCAKRSEASGYCYEIGVLRDLDDGCTQWEERQ